MRKIKSYVSNEVALDMTPMIDVTFQLIAFFMFVLNFSQVDQDQTVRLPASELAKPAEEVFDYPITIQLRSDSTAVLAGQEMPLAGVTKKIRDEASIINRIGKIKVAQATIIIRGDGDVPTGRAQELIRICQDQGFEKFSLRAKQARAGEDP